MKRLQILFLLLLAPIALYAEPALMAKLDRPVSITNSTLTLGIFTNQGKHIIDLEKSKNSGSTLLVDGEEVRQENAPILYTGFVRSRSANSATMLASADFFQGVLRVNFTGRRGKLYQVSFKLGERKGRLQHFPASVPIEIEGHTDFKLPRKQIQEDSVRKVRNVNFNRDVEIAIDVDYEYYLANGANTSRVNSDVVAIFNRVNTIYKNQLGLRIIPKIINIWTKSSDPYRSPIAYTRLTEFRNYYVNKSSFNGNIKHLMTGVDIAVDNDRSVVGIAFKGVVCRSPSFSFGVTERTSASIQHIVVAHEFGHNFDADHDMTSASLMSPAVSSNTSSFSSYSLGQIQNFINANNRCLNITEIKPQKPKIQLKLETPEKKKIKFITTTQGTSTQECSIDLYGAVSSVRLKGKFARATLLHTFISGPSDLPLEVETYDLLQRPSGNTHYRTKITCGKFSALSKVARLKSTSLKATKIKSQDFIDGLSASINSSNN